MKADPDMAAPVDGLDVARLIAHLQRRGLPIDGDIAVHPFQGGQSNPTYLIQDASHRYVVRKKPAGSLMPTAHAVDREYRVLVALAATDVPAPKPLLMCDDEHVIGQMFYVMEYVPGGLLSDMAAANATPSDRELAYRDFAGVLARIHAIDFRALGLQSFGRPGNYVVRQIQRLSQQYVATGLEPYPAMHRLERWLGDAVPETEDVSLVHGDYRPRNVLIDPQRPAVAAVLDWELATIGHPLADLAYTCLPYHMRGVDSEWDAERCLSGVPTEDEFLHRYATVRSASSLADYRYFVVFALYRSAVIRAGILARARNGQGRSATASERGMTYMAIASAAAALTESSSFGRAD